MFRRRPLRNALVAALPLLLAFGPGHAASVKTFLNSGTGFFVNRDGYVLTNLHVVKHCQRILLTGAVSTREARIEAQNSDQDLALLKTDVWPTDVGEFRMDGDPLKDGDRVLIVGYPGEAFRSGHTVTRSAEVLSTTGPKGEDKWLQISDVVSEGNSGGPLLDTSGNVVGVVAAKALIYTYRTDAPENGTTSQTGIAISQPAVLDFLEKHGVRYRTANSGIYLSADRITDDAHRFIVNVQCEYKTELR